MFENIIEVLLVLMLTLLCGAVLLLIQWLKEVIKNERSNK